MLGPYVADDLELRTLANHLPFQTTKGAAHFTEQLLRPTTNIPLLKKIQLPLLALRRINLQPFQTALTEFQQAESTLDECTSVSMDPLAEESTEQVVWNPTTTLGALCNQSPFLLESTLTWKTIALPSITILSPFFAAIIPYIVLYAYKQNPPLQEYLTTIRSIVRGAITVPSVLQSKGESDRIGYVLESLYICIMIGVCLTSIWSQITAALHLRSVAANLREKGTRIRNGIGAAESLYAQLAATSVKHQRALRSLMVEGKQALDPFRGTTDTGLGLYARLWKQTDALKTLHTWVGRVDAHVTIASLSTLCFPRWNRANSPHIEFTRVVHPLLPHPVPNDFTIHTGALLTGPNRGGKSTFCKSVGLSLVCAQSWGFAFASSARLTPFARIETALSPADTFGRLSLFEAEIAFAKGVLEASEQPLFVMMDEIFHSTNAADGMEASRIFLQRLYECPSTLSLISTHYRSLAEEFSTITPLQAETVSKGDRLEYTYRILPGISTASSVMEILREKGLLKNHLPSTEP